MDIENSIRHICIYFRHIDINFVIITIFDVPHILLS